MGRPDIVIPLGETAQLETVGRWLGKESPAQFTLHGDPAIWTRITDGEPTIGLVSSGRVPAGAMLRIHDWAHGWRQHGPIVISGFHSPTEEEALHVLLGGSWPVVLVLARGMVKRLRSAWRQPVDEGRLLLVSPFPDTVTQVSARTAHQRNRVVCALADQVLVAYADPDSKTLALVEEILTWGKPILTVDHAANQHLLEMGVGEYVPPAATAPRPGVAPQRREIPGRQ